MSTDAELLRRYVDDKSESAFTELVQRHLGLVYSVSLRRVGGDAHLAEDVAQKVFADLARKSSSLLDRPTLGGWLYASAHLASAAIVRSERRRKAREAAAHSMQTSLSSSEPGPDWARLRPVIDDAVVTLRDDDREAIALRFFEKRSFAEIGAALRVTDEAARKRVDRALEQLRAQLARRGITSTATVLGLALGAIGAATPPATLCSKVAAHALSTSAAGTSLPTTITGALWPAAAALIVGGVLFNAQSTTTASLRSEVARLTAENVTLARVRAENIRLAREIAALSDAPIQAPAPVAAPAPVETAAAPRKINAQITVNPEGRLAWNGEPVSLGTFINQLRALQAGADPEGRVHIRAIGAEFSPLTYVIDEVRKTQLGHVTVESTATPDSRLHAAWFWF